MLAVYLINRAAVDGNPMLMPKPATPSLLQHVKSRPLHNVHIELIGVATMSLLDRPLIRRSRRITRVAWGLAIGIRLTWV